MVYSPPFDTLNMWFVPRPLPLNGALAGVIVPVNVSVTLLDGSVTLPPHEIVARAAAASTAAPRKTRMMSFRLAGRKDYFTGGRLAADGWWLAGFGGVCRILSPAIIRRSAWLASDAERIACRSASRASCCASEIS